MPRDGADVEEVLTVFTQGVFWRLVTGLEVLSQGGPVWTQQLAEVTPTPLPVQWSWNKKSVISGITIRFEDLSHPHPDSEQFLN